MARGSSANPSCSISANLDAQEGVSGSVRLTARNSVTPSAQDSDATGYDFFNRTPAFQNCSSQQYITDVRVGDVAVLIIDVPVILSAPTIAHAGSQRFTGQLTSSHCPSSRFIYDITLSCNDGRLSDTAAFAMCTAF